MKSLCVILILFLFAKPSRVKFTQTSSNPESYFGGNIIDTLDSGIANTCGKSFIVVKVRRVEGSMSGNAILFESKDGIKYSPAGYVQRIRNRQRLSFLWKVANRGYSYHRIVFFGYSDFTAIATATLINIE